MNDQDAPAALKPGSASRGGRGRRGGSAAPPAPSFHYVRGVRLGGTNISCDALGSAGELVFLSHAQALGAIATRRPALARVGRQEVLATDQTLSLLGPLGDRLRRNALPAAFGRPFALGDARVELFPSGHLPGAASLLVQTEGRRMIYAGTVRTGRPALGAPPGELRLADAVCVEGTFGHPRFQLPDLDEVLGLLKSFVRDCAAGGMAPVLLTSPFGTAMETAAALAGAGLRLRGHRSIIAAASAFRVARVETPVIARFDGKLAADEALLWPPEARAAPLLQRLSRARFAFVSGFSLDPAALVKVGAQVAIPLSSQAGYGQLLAYIKECGAKEVAVHRGHAEELAADLRARGLQAYALGPPRQLDLFRG